MEEELSPTDVVCIGQNTHKVLVDAIVTKDDDICSQRHEKAGTVTIYEQLDTHHNGPIHVATHARNTSINKYLRENRPETINQNDTWHASKYLETAMSKVSKGSQKDHGVTWHIELSDKVASTKTHVQYAMRNCDNDKDTLLSNLDNILLHYQNNHINCNPLSRCRTEPNYEPSKIIVRNEKAISLFKKAIQSTVIYTNPSDYILAKDTYYVESFNNVLNMFQDKRISFQNEEYTRRSQMAVCHWAENVNIPYTSMWEPPSRNIERVYGDH